MLEVEKQAHKFLSKGEGNGEANAIRITMLSILIQYGTHFLQGKI